MCGIGGFVDYQRDARQFLPAAQRMKRTLTPRGPDAEGGFSSPDALLVHRRLIVIDPDGGRQPMYSPDGNTILIYNGELYNTEDIRSDLVLRGHHFTGHSDTEVLLHAFLEWGTDAFPRLNGIFAFAIWQKAERRLTLCRDRLGVKPLFLARTDGGLVFGSTIGTVLCHPDVEPAIDADGLRTLLLLGPARPPAAGVFRQIESLLPGHYAVLTPERIAPNMVFCVDIGIYHEEWGIGFRVEDNCLVTPDGCENLSALTPRTIPEIEETMRRNFVAFQ